MLNIGQCRVCRKMFYGAGCPKHDVSTERTKLICQVNETRKF